MKDEISLLYAKGAERKKRNSALQRWDFCRVKETFSLRPKLIPRTSINIKMFVYFQQYILNTGTKIQPWPCFFGTEILMGKQCKGPERLETKECNFDRLSKKNSKGFCFLLKE